MRVLSILNGDNYSFLAIQPRIAMNMDGAMVISGFEACIRVSERPGEYLRCAKQVQEQKSGNKVNTNGRQEVNCSLEKSVWTVNVYQSCEHFCSQLAPHVGDWMRKDLEPMRAVCRP